MLGATVLNSEELENLTILAGQKSWYPELDKLIEIVNEEIELCEETSFLTTEECRSLTVHVFNALCKAELRGLITSANEHEYARAALETHSEEMK